VTNPALVRSLQAVTNPGVKKGAVGLIVALIALLAPSIAAAARSAPETQLRAGGHSQLGGVVWEEWTYPDGPYCVASSGDGAGTFPRSLHLGDGIQHARFVLLRRQKPAEVTITAWHRVDSHGHETGPSEELPYTLVPRRDGDGILTAWRVRFSVDPPPRYYLHLYVRWPNGECGGPRHVLRTYSLGP